MHSNVKITKSQHTLIMFALFLILFLDGFGQSLIFPILTRTLLSPNNNSLVQNLTIHDREVLYGIIIGLFYFCWMIGTAILGDLSDSYGRKKGLIICIAGMIIGNLLTVLAFALSNVWLIIIGRTIIGFTAGSQAIAQATIVDISGQDNQARNTGLIILAVTLGAIIGPAYGQIFSDPHNFYLFNDKTPFIGVVLLSLLTMFILLFFYCDVHQPNRKHIKVTRVIDIFKDAVAHPQIRILLLSTIGIFGCWSIYYTYMTIYLVKTLSATSGNISVFMSMYGVGASIAMALLGGIVEKWFTIKQAVVIGWSLLAMSTLLTQLSTSLNIDFMLAIVAGLGVGIGMLFTMKAFSVQVSSEQQGWVMGVFNASWVGVMGVSVMVTGYIASFGIVVPLIIGYILFGWGITLFIRRVTV